MLERLDQQPPDALLALMNLEIWSRLFLDGQSHADLAGELAEQSLAA